MKTAVSFDVEPDLHTGKFLSITEVLPRIKAILDENNVKGTFFTTCDCIENYPDIFRILLAEGHEIALHGYRHSRFDDLTIQERDDSIRKSIEVFRRYLGIKPKGFRAPQHSINKQTLAVLDKYGLEYDSSKTPLNFLQVLLFPMRLKSNITNFFSIPTQHRIGRMYEIPTSSLVIPFVSLLPRVFPKIIQKAYIKLISSFYKDLVFYAHSWDFIKLPESRIDRKYPHTRVIENLDFIIKYLKRTHHIVPIERWIN